LESTDLSITDIAEQSGFHSDTALRQHFLKKHKISPNRWRKQFQIEDV
jgi:transcriptional regulator, araC family